ncbi:MAG: PilZ domain-containing protein [Candidatus Aminicenantales bacterium]
MENRKDKRFLERDSTRIKDMCLDQETSGKRGVNAYTHDLSVSGARISSTLDFPVGYVLRIVIDLGGADPSLEVDGEVVWTRKNEDGKRFDIGVEFLHNLSDTILLLINHFYGKEVGIPSLVS